MYIIQRERQTERDRQGGGGGGEKQRHRERAGGMRRGRGGGETNSLDRVGGGGGDKLTYNQEKGGVGVKPQTTYCQTAQISDPRPAAIRALQAARTDVRTHSPGVSVVRDR